MEKGKLVTVHPDKEKQNQGSGKVVVTKDVKGNQLYAKETKMHLDQRKKMDIREDKNFKIDVNSNLLYAKESKMNLDQRKMDVREDKTLKKQETLIRRKTEEDPKPGNCCGSGKSGDPCGGCDAECFDLVIMILCFPAFMFD